MTEMIETLRIDAASNGESLCVCDFGEIVTIFYRVMMVGG